MSSGQAVLAPSGNAAVGKTVDQVPVSPKGGGIMDVDEGDDQAEEGDEEAEEDGEGVIRVDEEVQRKDAVEDKRGVQRLSDPRKPTQAEVE